ncbi:MAG: peptidoglycan editing factor PgeF [Campylobacteraceae bacterium]|jgi:YfiH family protein|nr:peptidoglycan editing factor PgeF [Campylobacteraceae bacterium]
MREIFLHEDIQVVESDRFGGVSKGRYESLNLGLHVGDEPLNVNKNREIFASFFDADVAQLCFMEQVHGNSAIFIDTNSTPKADAIIAKNRDLILCVMVADCVPVVLFDAKNSIIAAVHAGRKGVFSDIITNTVSIMRHDFETKPENVKAFIGASINACCYEIKDEVAKEAKEKFAFALEKRDEKYFLNLQKITKLQLNKNSITDILHEDICTSCDKRYFSYRRDGICGRFGIGVKIRKI